MTPSLLMPDPQAARESGLTDDYSAYRKWWGKHVAKTVRLGRRKRPEPGELPISDAENG